MPQTRWCVPGMASTKTEYSPAAIHAKKTKNVFNVTWRSVFKGVFSKNKVIFSSHQKTRHGRRVLRMTDKTNKKPVGGKSLSVWLYDGTPEFLDVNVAPASLLDGGHVMIVMLANGDIRLAATRSPGKYITSLRYQGRRFGLPEIEIVRVVVTKPHLRYEAIKRVLAVRLGAHESDAPGVYRADVERIKQMVEEIWGKAVFHGN